MTSPSVGRIVHYVSHGSPILEDGTQRFKSQCRAAIIAEVLGETMLELCVLNPTGLFFDHACIEDIEKLAKLSRLKLSTEEKEKYRKDMDSTVLGTLPRVSLLYPRSMTDHLAPSSIHHSTQEQRQICLGGSEGYQKRIC